MSIGSMTTAHTVTKLTRTQAVGDQLGKSVTYALPDDVAANQLRCTVCPMQGRDAERWYQRGVIVPHAVYFSFDPGLTEKDMLRWDDKGTYLQVVGVPLDAHGQGRLFKVIADAASIDNHGRVIA